MAAASRFESVPRFGLLLTAMLAEVMLAPVLATSTFGLVMARVATGLVLVAALYAVGFERRTVVAFVVALSAQVVGLALPSSPMIEVAIAVRVVFFSSVIVLIVGRALRDRNVTFDTVAGSACAYLLLGVVWGDLFLLLESLRPGSFEVPDSWKLGVDLTPRTALMYFSFSTLTTSDFGVVNPKSLGAGALCVGEALVGQLYLAIMIARLVGLHVSQRRA